MVVTAMVACTSCAHVERSSAAAKLPLVLVRGLGTACLDGTRYGDPSYLVGDIGRAGVPPIRAKDRAMLARIMQYVHPSTLRFLYTTRSPEFIVFDSPSGACPGAPVQVLNAPYCNTMYDPGVLGGSFPATGRCYTHPRPWIPGDLGNPRAQPRTGYNNGY